MSTDSFFLPDTYPVRRPAQIARYLHPGVIRFYSSSNTDLRCESTPSALFVWYLCDGQHTLAQIRAAAAAHYKLSETLIAQDIDEVLQTFLAQDFICLDRTASARPVLHVAYQGFHNDYATGDNYFISLLSQQCDLVVNPVDMAANVVFVASTTDQADPLRPEWQTAYRIGVAMSGDLQCCPGQHYDLTVGPEHMAQYGDLHCTMPIDRYSSLDISQWADLNTAGERLLAMLSLPQEKAPKVVDTPKKHPLSKETPRLTIGMAVYDDFDGVYFTVQALRYYHPEVADQIEIIVLDNNPDGALADNIRKFIDQLGECGRYFCCRQFAGTAIRDYVFYYARGEYVLCMDSHVFIEPGGLKALIDYLDANPNSLDLIQGPLLHDDLHSFNSHFDPVWRNGMLGTWGIDDRATDLTGAVFDIPAQGLGLFACRRSAWLGFNPRFRGFGGEECYLHLKFRKAGRRTLCLPALRWVHRFRSQADRLPYPNILEDRIRNYFLGYTELGLDIYPIIDHFTKECGYNTVSRAHETWLLEQSNPFSFFDNIYCITSLEQSQRWEQMQRRFRALGIEKMVTRHIAVLTPENHHIGCALSHRAVCEHADYHEFERILILEDDALFLDATLLYLRWMLKELLSLPWRRFYLGACRWKYTHPKAPGCRYIDIVTEEAFPVTCAHAIAYSRSGYRELLDVLPQDKAGMYRWLQSHFGFDQFLGKLLGNYLANPMLSTQPDIRNMEDGQIRGRFTLGD